MQTSFLDLNQPVLLPIPDSRYIFIAAGFAAGAADLGDQGAMGRLANYVTGQLNAHPILAGTNTNFDPVRRHITGGGNHNERRIATETLVSFLSLLDGLQNDPEVTDGMKEKLRNIARANNDWNCLPGCIMKAGNMLRGARSIRQEGLEPRLFEAKLNILEEDIYKGIVSGTGIVEQGVMAALNLGGGNAFEVHNHTAIGNALSEFTKIPKKVGDHYADNREPGIRNSNAKMQTLKTYLRNKLGEKATAAKVVSCIISDMLPEMPQNTLNVATNMVQVMGEHGLVNRNVPVNQANYSKYNDILGDIRAAFTNLGFVPPNDNNFVYFPNMNADDDDLDYNIVKFKPNIDAILRRNVVERLRENLPNLEFGYISLEYEDMVELPQVSAFIKAADDCGVNLRGNYNNLDMLLAGTIDGLKGSNANRTSCIAMARAVKALGVALPDMNGYIGQGHIEVQARQQATRKIAEVLHKIDDICVEKEVVGPGVVTSHDEIYKIFCDHSPRMVAYYLAELKKASRDGALQDHGGHADLFISPHAILDKCPPKLISRMAQVSEIMQRMETGNEVTTNLIDNLCWLLNVLYQIFDMGVCSTKMDMAIVKLHDISADYQARHNDEPVERTATKVQSFVEKLACPNHFAIGAYDRGAV